ncbi:hypothetical protein [Tenacibaculum agarivorans]|uniref:hypothetical protein n=1 Tax=Tenacibaculum agarivorans TaxID=1908389 RepID=UPI00094BA7D5|nr:hypothetical protein [Tenacibaculum agarivorans]
MEIQQLELLASSLRVLGLNLDIPTLDLIFTLNKELVEKEASISLAEIHKISMEMTQKYNLDKQ